jgi:hypothetical protein
MSKTRRKNHEDVESIESNESVILLNSKSNKYC